MNTHNMKTLLQFPCPTSSPLKALVWFELKSGGLRVLAFGMMAAVLIYFLFAISIPFYLVRPVAIFGAFGVVPAMLIFGRNAFGIRRKYGRTAISSFEAIQPCGTAQLAAVKVVVRTACVIVAMVAIGLTAWVSSALINDWGVAPDLNPSTAANLIKMQHDLLQTRSSIGREFFGDEVIGRKESIALPIVLTLIFAVAASFSAFRARYPRGTFAVTALLLLFFIGLENVPELLTPNGRSAIDWILVTAVFFTICYLLRNGFAERALTVRYVCGALAIAVAFMINALPPTANAIVTSILVPMMIFLLAPWALNRARHM